jgi:osmoprotectant transport system ATP-binding protein
MVNRLVELSSGKIIVNGRDNASLDPVELRRSIGYVFQGIGLFPHMSVGENVGTLPRLLRWDRERRERRVHELLELVGLPPQEFKHRRPATLSGGQQQRVGLARALAASPKIMLMDEPFGALDPITRATLQTEFQRLQRSLKLTVIMVTHDVTEALLIGDRIVVMQKGEIMAFGTPHELLVDSAPPYVSALMKVPLRQAELLAALAHRQGTG